MEDFKKLFDSFAQLKVGVIGDVMLDDVEDCYVRSEGMLTAVVGLQDAVVVVTKDAVLAMDYQADYGRLAIEQLELADLVGINKTDLVAPKDRAVLKGRIAAISERARVWETTFGAVPLELIFGESRRSAGRIAQRAVASAQLLHRLLKGFRGLVRLHHRADHERPLALRVDQ